MRGLRAGAWAAAACLLLCLGLSNAQGSSTPAAASGPGAAPAPSGGGSQVFISEIVSNNKASLKDEDGSSPSWVELYNTGGSALGLAGYALTNAPPGAAGGDVWTFPSGVSLAPGQYLVVFMSGKNRANPSSPLHTSFKLTGDDTYLALLAPGGALANAVPFAILQTDVSFGTLGDVGFVQSQAGGAPQYALLAAPTPGKQNTGPRPGGPLVVGTTRTVASKGGADIAVSSTVTASQFPLSKVELFYSVGYGPETSVPMTASSSGDVYTASIPGSQAPSGALVRWYVKATDAQGGATREPLFAGDGERQYWGTIVSDPSDAASLPVLEIYCQNDKAPFSKTEVPGCSAVINGSFYDNLGVRRRGVTSMNWPKPKVKIDAKQGSLFKIRPGMVVKEFNLNSEWAEVGENTWMREPLTWEVFRQMGVPWLVSYHMHVRMNGKYFGKFAFVEEMDEDSLRRWGYDVEPVGPLWKSTSGEYSNLRWDIPADQIQYFWKQYITKGNNASQGQALLDFARGLSGGAPGVPRSKYLFDALNLPEVVNYMAAQTLILNQDRCTKNFYVYRDPASGQWSIVPWDVESGFGIDRGLGGQPAPDYCILACEQWSSPLYCDHNHPQDLAVKTPWGLITAQYDIFTTGRRLQSSSPAGPTCRKAGAAGRGDPLAHAARKLLQGSPSQALGQALGQQGQAVAVPPTGAPAAASAQAGQWPANGAAAPGLVLPLNSSIPANYDEDLTKKGPTVTGAAGTFNYLIDAVLSVPRTREMYVRRLRSLMDQFIATGRLQANVDAMYKLIRDEAKRDAAAWSNPGDVDRGYQQLITEQLPIRKQQLYEVYSTSGPIPLIPDAQPGSFQLALGSLQAGPSGFVEVHNPNNFAVDISGYRLQGAVTFTFAPGTAIPAQDSLFAAPSIAAFLQRTSAPTGGQGAFVVGPTGGQVLGPAASVQVVRPDGSVAVSN